MITIRLLGGAKKAIGRPTVDLDRSSASVTEILQYLRSIAVDAHRGMMSRAAGRLMNARRFARR